MIEVQECLAIGAADVMEGIAVESEIILVAV